MGETGTKRKRKKGKKNLTMETGMNNVFAYGS